MRTEEFTFDLPEELIAQNPVNPRDSSKLMFLNRKTRTLEHHVFRDIAGILKKGDVLVFNKSKVIPARIRFKIGSRDAEILLIRKVNTNEWTAMVRPGKKFGADAEIKIDDSLTVKVIGVTDKGLRILKFNIEEGIFEDYLRKIGEPPYPPYIKNTKASFEDYQTVYADIEGSVAAPTAGLHFTDNIFKILHESGIDSCFVTLHIGPGTFQPVKSENIEEHVMHSEWYEMDEVTALKLNEAKCRGNRIIAVGTTSVRVLESNYMNSSFHAEEAETDIFIKPGYSWKCVDGLLTNFHLPKSSLIMLVCSFGGKEFVMNAYNEAIRKKYRFFSFGDSMLIL